MAAPRETLNKATLSVGFHAKFVTITAITADGLYAITTDRQYTETRVPLLVQRSKSALPQVGETWLIDQALGHWTFAAFVGKSAADFAGSAVALDVADLIYVQGAPPASPRPGDMWMNTTRGNELSQWQGSGWVALQLGTDAIANKSITSAKLADKTVTAQQISDAAGITASQVAFTVSDIGGLRVFTGTSQPSGMQPGDLWINPVQGNAMATWTGGVWHPLQFGALAIAPASITAAQISGSAGIGANQINFTARDIGGITTSISAAQPANPKTGDLWYDATNGYVLDQWNGAAWVPFQYGTNAIQAGSVTAALIAANTITAAQIAAGTITAAQIATGTITASLFAAVGTNDFNAYLAGGDPTGWTAFGGTFSVQQPAGAPYTNVAQISTDGVTTQPGILAAGAGLYPVMAGRNYLVSALVFTTQTSVEIGVNWINSSGGVISTVVTPSSVTASTWTYVYAIVTAPAGAVSLARFAGLPGVPAASTILQATAISALSGYDGGVITAGTITAAQIAAGSIVTGLLDANAIDGMTITGNVINSAVINASDVYLTGAAGGLFVYSSANNQTVIYYSASNSWTCPPNVTSVLVECWAAGGGGAYKSTSGNGAGGGAGGAYAASTISVTPGTTYTFVVGALGAGGTSGSPNGGTGGDTAWMTTVVVAKGGGGGTPTAAGTHTTGSTGTTVFQGGDGAAGAASAGGGGGGSAGPASSGNSATGYQGATAVSGGGPGGNGSNSAHNAAQTPSTVPGGGGGGGCFGTGINAGAAGRRGALQLTFTASSTSLIGSVAGAAGVDPIAGISFPEGAQFDHIRDSSGNQVSAAQTDPGTYTITGATDAAATAAWPIPANDPGGETVYDIWSWGQGTWGSTAQGWTVDMALNGTQFTNNPTLDSTTFNTGQTFNFEIHGRIMVTLTGSTGTFKYFLKITTSSNSHTPQNGYTAIRRGQGVAINTTVANTLGLQSSWAATTGAPTATFAGSVFQRLGA